MPGLFPCANISQTAVASIRLSKYPRRRHPGFKPIPAPALSKSVRGERDTVKSPLLSRPGCEVRRNAAGGATKTVGTRVTDTGRPILILMADDDPEDRMLAQEALEEASLAKSLYFVKDGEELLDYLDHRGQYTDNESFPRPRLILLDLNMPRMDGREALAKIKRDPDLRQIPVVVLTTSKPESTEGRREDSGRGWVRELQGRWPGVGVDGRPADGLQSPHRAPKALCGSCDARDGERIRSRGLSRPGWREIAGTLSQLQAAVRPGTEWLAAGPRRD